PQATAPRLPCPRLSHRPLGTPALGGRAPARGADRRDLHRQCERLRQSGNPLRTQCGPAATDGTGLACTTRDGQGSRCQSPPAYRPVPESAGPPEPTASAGPDRCAALPGVIGGTPLRRTDLPHTHRRNRGPGRGAFAIAGTPRPKPCNLCRTQATAGLRHAPRPAVAVPATIALAGPRSCPAPGTFRHGQGGQ